MDTRLTREVDLSSLSEATLRFQAWYDLENQFDFVYLSASRDGGRTWQVLPGRNTVADKATGNNYGVGWTGSSGADWVDEEVELTPFAGSDVLLRFEYVTDQSYNGQGFALRNVSIPELDLDEPGAAEDAWTAEGFVRIDGPIPERWNLRLVRWTPQGTFVDRLGVALDGTATFPLDPTATRQTLVDRPDRAKNAPARQLPAHAEPVATWAAPASAADVAVRPNPHFPVDLLYLSIEAVISSAAALSACWLFSCPSNTLSTAFCTRARASGNTPITAPWVIRFTGACRI